MRRFQLRFDLRDVPVYAARYAYADDNAVLAIARQARRRGYYTREEFVAVCRWKTTRSGPLAPTTPPARSRAQRASH
jgi:hypothetical protein